METTATPSECFPDTAWRPESRPLPPPAAKHRTGLLFAILAVLAIHAGIACLIARLTRHAVDNTPPRTPLRVGLVTSKPSAPAPVTPPSPKPAAAAHAPPPRQRHAVMSTSASRERSISPTPAVTSPSPDAPVQTNPRPAPDTQAKPDTTAQAATNSTTATALPGDAPKTVRHADCNVQAPEYPLAARRLKQHGRVMIRLNIDEYGHVVTADIEHSSGSELLDEAARKAALAAPCQPYREGTRAMAVYALQPFDFVPAR